MRSCPKLAALVWALPAVLTAKAYFAGEDPVLGRALAEVRVP